MIGTIKEHAMHAPNRLAVVGGERLTYAEFEDATNAVASFLVSRAVGPGSIVAVYGERNAESIVAMIGIAKAGAAYTFVEASDASRETLELLSSGPFALTFTGRVGAEAMRARGLTPWPIEEARRYPERRVLDRPGSADAIYVIFTSGSSGARKGVVVTHGNVEHYTRSILARLGVDRALSYAHVSTLAADLGNTCLFLPLFSGGTVHVVDETTRRDPPAFWAYLATERIEFLKMTPSHWRVMFEAAEGRVGHTLDYLLLGGEALSPMLAGRILESGVSRTLVNHYGPTETTIGVTVHVITRDDLLARGGAASVPIGRPFGSTRVLVRDEQGVLCEKGAEGELFVGGPSVARGYLNDATRSAERFRTDIEPSTRFYRTGDHVRIDDDGTVEFRGRIDRQVKVMGFRVELEHVESALRKLDGVSLAFACCLEVRGRRQLVAAVVPHDSSVAPRTIKERLAAQVPHYMVPTDIVLFEDLPLTTNGKIDLRAARERLEAGWNAQVASAPALEAQEDDPLLREIIGVWQRRLGRPVDGVDTNFFDIGGDSIAAIQVISDLQKSGYEISASAFGSGLTIRAMADAIRQLRELAAPVAEALGARESALTPAQRWFFAQDFAQPNHWNQAILLESHLPLAPELARAAMAAVVAAHPMLRSVFVHRDGQWQVRECEADVEHFTWSALAVGGDAEIGAQIASASERAQHAIDLGARLFRAHLFSLEQGQDQLLLVAHHLAVDAVSWRLIVSDFVDAYAALERGHTHELPAPRLGVADWVLHLQRHHESLRADLEFWRDVEVDASTQLARQFEGSNDEGSARAIWFALSREQTDALERRLPGCGLAAILLGVFNRAVAARQGLQRLAVELESHGRASLENEVDVSRVVGWFTSAFPVVVNVAGTAEENVRRVQDLFTRIPQLGVAYGACDFETRQGRSIPRICYNYLGRFSFPQQGGCALAPSRYQLACARGAANDRVHDWKLTARVLEGQLVVDLSYSARRFDTLSVRELIRDVRRDLSRLGQVQLADSQDIAVEDGSSTGLLMHCPERLGVRAVRRMKKYERVFVTGATGYLGVHLLRGLLERTNARIDCLVRSVAGETGWSRLRNAYKWFFDEDLEDQGARIAVIDGDLGQDRFGLEPRPFEDLCEAVDAIYHFGADTRLFGDGSLIERQNLTSVRAAIALASRNRPKDLHFMSTLAVSGTVPKSRGLVFHEQCLDVGQSFLNAYERSKYDGELLMREFRRSGGVGFVYRAGNVSGHSRTGTFQRNAESNRLIQILRALVRVGKVPSSAREPITLTPVDDVIDAVLALSLGERGGGAFHVDGAHSNSLGDIYECLRELGVPLESVQETTLRDVLGVHGDPTDPIVALGSFWANRDERNVVYDCSWTQRVLRGLGMEFRVPDGRWLRTFLEGLLDRGVFWDRHEFVRAARLNKLARHAHAELARDLTGGGANA